MQNPDKSSSSDSVYEVRAHERLWLRSSEEDMAKIKLKERLVRCRHDPD